MTDDLPQQPPPETAPNSPVELIGKAKRFRWTIFALILLCFTLPFIQVSCQQQRLMSFTGFQMAFGTEVQQPQMFGPPQTKQIPGDGLVILAFLAAVAGLVCSFIKNRTGIVISLICSSGGFLFLLIFKLRVDNEILRLGGGMLGVEYLTGFIGACLLFLMGTALNGYMIYAEANDTSTSLTPTNTTDQIDKVMSSATGVGLDVQEWFVKKDLPGWLRSHRVVLAATGVALVLILIGYYGFIRPSPTADGKKAALLYTNCQTTYKAKVDSAYQSFLNEFATQSNETRADAEQKVTSLLSAERQAYYTCDEAAQAHYVELSSRYKDDPEGLTAFSAAFTENNGGSKSADEVEQSSSLFAKVNEKIQSIRAPFPESSRIANDLVGQSMDGWNFAYASEFKNVTIINTKPDGDTLFLRTHLDLEDYITKEPYFSVLDVKYSLNSNGEWEYKGITELLHNKSDVNYFIGDEIFLVGRWRWQNNYATYNPDGTWFGKTDNGDDMVGTWRIVKGNLVLTLKGQNWLNKKIVQFSKNELIVDETAPVRAERLE
jgi:hypothetical protein